MITFDTHTENALSNETYAVTKSMNIRKWEISASNQLFIRGSHTEITFSIKK